MVAEFRRDTDEIIAVNPVSISFVRILREKDSYGNERVIGKVTVDPQDVRIAEISHNESERLMEQGVLPVHVVNITAKYDADIIAGDRFAYMGSNYEIVFIRPITYGGQDEEHTYKKSGKARAISEEL